MLEAKPTLTQVQIIQSLGEALSWFEKEVSWGVSPGELNHLTGRIGELYAAMITRGQMALDTNQRGYDVVTASNERTSVKTVTTSSHVTFNLSTFHLVDRVMILRVNVDEETGISVEELLDEPADVARQTMRIAGDRLVYAITPTAAREKRPVEEMRVVARASWRDLDIVRYEGGPIRVLSRGIVQPVVVKDVLRPIAAELGIGLLNSKGEAKNTRTLGAEVIRAIELRAGASDA